MNATEISEITAFCGMLKTLLGDEKLRELLNGDFTKDTVVNAIVSHATSSEKFTEETLLIVLREYVRDLLCLKNGEEMTESLCKRISACKNLESNLEALRRFAELFGENGDFLKELVEASCKSKLLLDESRAGLLYKKWSSADWLFCCNDFCCAYDELFDVAVMFEQDKALLDSVDKSKLLNKVKYGLESEEHLRSKIKGEGEYCSKNTFINTLYFLGRIHDLALYRAPHESFESDEIFGLALGEIKKCDRITLTDDAEASVNMILRWGQKVGEKGIKEETLQQNLRELKKIFIPIIVNCDTDKEKSQVLETALRIVEIKLRGKTTLEDAVKGAQNYLKKKTMENKQIEWNEWSGNKFKLGNLKNDLFGDYSNNDDKKSVISARF